MGTLLWPNRAAARILNQWSSPREMLAWLLFARPGQLRTPLLRGISPSTVDASRETSHAGTRVFQHSLRITYSWEWEISVSSHTPLITYRSRL